MIQLPNLSQPELIKYLVANKMQLIDLKKSAIKYADATGGIVASSGLVSKALANDQDTADSIKRTLVGNTYNWMDSHDDVHLDNTFTTSLKERAGKIRHQHDHLNQLTAKVGKFSNVYEQVVNWSDVGVNRMGQTIALLGDSEIKRAYNPLIFESYKDGEIDQHSVGMQYVKILLAVNNPENKEEYENWNKYIGKLGNPERALEKGYFWPVKEAKLIEISCVTEGSNELTGMYNPPNGSVKIDPPQSSQPIKTIFDYLN